MLRPENKNFDNFLYPSEDPQAAYSRADDPFADCPQNALIVPGSILANKEAASILANNYVINGIVCAAARLELTGDGVYTFEGGEIVSFGSLPVPGFC